MTKIVFFLNSAPPLKWLTGTHQCHSTFLKEKINIIGSKIIIQLILFEIQQRKLQLCTTLIIVKVRLVKFMKLEHMLCMYYIFAKICIFCILYKLRQKRSSVFLHSMSLGKLFIIFFNYTVFLFKISTFQIFFSHHNFEFLILCGKTTIIFNSFLHSFINTSVIKIYPYVKPGVFWHLHAKW